MKKDQAFVDSAHQYMPAAENLRENEEGELVDEDHDEEDDEAQPDAKRGRYDDWEGNR